MNQPEPSIGITKAISACVFAIVLTCAIFEIDMWPIAIISIALAIMGASIAFLMYDKEKKW